MPKELKSTTELRVRFHECDPMQIVWHGNYLKYFEEGAEDFGKQHGVSYLDMKKEGLLTPMVKSVCEHKSPLRYGDVFTVETTFVNSEAAKIQFSYKITSRGKLACIGQTIQVFTDEKGDLLLNNPQFFLDWKKKMGLL
ncbi:MAG: thioesterase family protein [Salegentibacter sp.]